MSSTLYGFGFFTRPPSCLLGKEDSFFSLWLTARTINCPSTLKKGASQSKSLLNDRVRSLFGRSLEPLLSSGRQLPPLLLLPAPRRFLPLFRQSFSPLAPLVFSTARFRRVFSVFLYAGAIGGLCRCAGFHVKQTRTHRCFMSSTASRGNSRPHPLPGCLFHLSVLNDYLARTFPPARRSPY